VNTNDPQGVSGIPTFTGTTPRGHSFPM